MKDRRKHVSLVTPASEDAGLFNKPVVQVPVELLPEVHRNLRQDLLVRAIVQGDHEVTVVFAGRRMKQAAGLLRHLKRLGAQSRQADRTSQQAERSASAYRVKMMIEGSWRVKFSRDDEGWESKDYHLIAARWQSAQGGAPAGSYPLCGR